MLRMRLICSVLGSKSRDAVVSSDEKHPPPGIGWVEEMWPEQLHGSLLLCNHKRALVTHPCASAFVVQLAFIWSSASITAAQQHHGHTLARTAQLLLKVI